MSCTVPPLLPNATLQRAFGGVGQGTKEARVVGLVSHDAVVVEMGAG